MEFNPQAAEDKARAVCPALDKALTRKEEEKQRYFGPVVEYFARLEVEIANLTIASRFKRDVTPNFLRGGIKEETIIPTYTNLNEADFKRAQLLIHLNQIRAEALMMIGNVEDLVMDIEATQAEN